MATSDALLDIFLDRGMFGSGPVEIIDSNPNKDPRLGENMPFLIGRKGTDDSQQIRIVIDMLPPELKAAYDRGADLTGCIVEAGTSTYDSNWYAFLMAPQKTVRCEVTISKRSGRKRGCPEVRVFEKCGSVEVGEIETLILVSLSSLNTEARTKWPDYIRQMAEAAFARWERSKQIAENAGQLSKLTSTMMDLTEKMVKIEYLVDSGVVIFRFCDEFLMEAYIVDLVDDAAWLAQQVMSKVTQLMS